MPVNWNWLNTGIVLKERIENDQLNNFRLIRLIAALLVVETHSHILKERQIDIIPHETFRFSLLGLPSFFFLSGLLVSQSLFKSSSWKNFLWKRVLRLYPAACLAVLCCALLMGPLVTEYCLKDYFSSPVLYRYLTTCLLVKIQYRLPGVFEHSVLKTDSVNSSLWSIALELKLYAGLLIVWLLKIPWKRYLLMLLIIATVLGGYFFYNRQSSVTFMGQPVQIYQYTTYAPLFLIGVFCDLYKGRIIIRTYWIFPIIIAFFLSRHFHILELASFILLPAFLLYAATTGVSWLKKITPKADLSYGIYVFAFPVQQLAANYLHPADPFRLFLLSLLLVLPLALFSWHLVEKKALQFKHLVK